MWKMALPARIVRRDLIVRFSRCPMGGSRGCASVIDATREELAERRADYVRDRRPMAAEAVITDTRGRVLLVNPSHHRNRRLMPGGGMELGASSRSACARELREEPRIDCPWDGCLSWAGSPTTGACSRKSCSCSMARRWTRRRRVQDHHSRRRTLRLGVRVDGRQRPESLACGRAPPGTSAVVRGTGGGPSHPEGGSPASMTPAH